jgi:hypothetical protein
MRMTERRIVVKGRGCGMGSNEIMGGMQFSGRVGVRLPFSFRPDGRWVWLGEKRLEKVLGWVRFSPLTEIHYLQVQA